MGTFMESRGRIATIGLIFIIGFLVGITACDTNQSVGLQDSLSTVSDLELINGAENASATVNKGTDSYFSVDLANIAANDQIREGNSKGWCIVWNKPIASDNDRHDGLKLYSSYGDDNWRPVNYLLNIKPQLESKDPDLTYREIQAAIWTLMDFPKFDLNQLSIDEIPDRLVRNGQYNFDKKKVDQIVSHVKQNYESFQYNGASTYAAVMETPSDTQTIIVEVGGSAWAYGQLSFRGQEYKDIFNVNVPGRARWGWIYELDESYASTELISGGGDDDGTKDADEIGTNIGSLDMSREGNQMDVTYSAFSNYLVNDLHLWVGCTVTDFPTSGAVRNPSLNRFKFTYDSEPTASHTFSVDLPEYNCSGSVYISAHAGELYQKVDNELPDDPVTEPVFKMTDLSQYGLPSAVDINDHGHIVGSKYYWNSDTKELIDMGISSARALNNYGEVVFSGGYYWHTDSGLIENDNYNYPYEYEYWAYVYHGDINNKGEIVGGVDILEHLTDEEGNHTGYLDWDYGAYWENINANVLEISFILDEYNLANGINDEGWVVGGWYVGSYLWHSTTGVMEFADYPEIVVGEPHSINNKKQVVGAMIPPDGVNIQQTKSKEDLDQLSKDIASLYSLTKTNGQYHYSHVLEMIRNSTFETEVDLKIRGSRTYKKIYNTITISDKLDQIKESQLYSTQLTSTNHDQAFIWDEHNGFEIIGTLGGNTSIAWDINDHGQVVGYSLDNSDQWHAFYWDEKNGILKLPTLGGNSSQASAINNKGQIVGYSYDSNNEKIPVMWEITNGAAKIASK